MNLPKFAKNIEMAINMVYKNTKIRTRDLGGSNTSDEFTDAIIKNLEILEKSNHYVVWFMSNLSYTICYKSI